MKWLLVVMLAGCSVGGSSSVVGRWRARRVIDSTACMQTAPETAAPGAAPSACSKPIAIGRDYPARRFQSFSTTFLSSGYAQQRHEDGDVGHGIAMNSYFEYVRGRGAYAIGGRVGGFALAGLSKGGDEGRLVFLTPVSLIGHFGDLWGSIYAGGGYAPVSYEEIHIDETMSALVWHHNSFHGFAGTRFWLTRSLERGISLNPELRVDTFGDSILYSLTVNCGLHL